MATQVTVNGVPVEQLIKQQDADEIRQVHRKDSTIPRRPLGASKHNGNLSGERTSKGQVVYQAGQKETHVIVAGMVFPWHEKAPYVRSGMSILGGFEHNAETGEIKCHECGEWFHGATHVLKHGRLRPKEYRLRHGLKATSAVASPRTRRRLSELAHTSDGIERWNAISRMGVEGRNRAAKVASGKVQASAYAEMRGRASQGFSPNPELANLRTKCCAQLKASIMEMVSALGRTPSREELAERGIHDVTLTRMHGGAKVRAIFKSWGLKPRAPGKRTLSNDVIAS